VCRLLVGERNKVDSMHFIPQVNYTASVVQLSEFLTTDPEVPGSIPGSTRFTEKWRVWNGSTQLREDD
jgi:hypothetical protein